MIFKSSPFFYYTLANEWKHTLNVTWRTNNFIFNVRRVRAQWVRSIRSIRDSSKRYQMRIEGLNFKPQRDPTRTKTKPHITTGGGKIVGGVDIKPPSKYLLWHIWMVVVHHLFLQMLPSVRHIVRLRMQCWNTRILILEDFRHPE